MPQRRKILIIDDEPSFTNMVKLNLESSGRYEVAVENKGSEGLNTALEYRPDLILLDVIMPDKEGPDVLRQIRNNEVIGRTPIVFLTATITKDEVESENGSIGGHLFLAKPGTIQDLIECIESELENSAEPSEST